MAGGGCAPPRLDGFVLTERLGTGTYATVYKAYSKVREHGASHPAGSPSLRSWGGRNLGGLWGVGSLHGGLRSSPGRGTRARWWLSNV